MMQLEEYFGYHLHQNLTEASQPYSADPGQAAAHSIQRPKL